MIDSFFGFGASCFPPFFSSQDPDVVCPFSLSHGQGRCEPSLWSATTPSCLAGFFRFFPWQSHLPTLFASFFRIDSTLSVLVCAPKGLPQWRLFPPLSVAIAQLPAMFLWCASTSLFLFDVSLRNHLRLFFSLCRG